MQYGILTIAEARSLRHAVCFLNQFVQEFFATVGRDIILRFCIAINTVPADGTYRNGKFFHAIAESCLISGMDVAFTIINMACLCKHDFY